MRGAWAILTDVLLEAIARRWVIGLLLVITATLLAIAVGVELEVVDGALAATKLLGVSEDMSHDIRAVDVALRPVFQGAAYLIFYVGLPAGILAFADFAPRLVAPGRIEHLLALPVHRAAILAGTFLGVVLIALVMAMYGAGGFTLVLGIKTGVYTERLLVAGLMAWVAFAGIYGAMVAASVFVRSSAISAGVGFVVFVAGIVASYRYELAPAMSEGWTKAVAYWLLAGLPPVADLANDAVALVGHVPVDGAVGRRLAGTGVFALAMVALGIWRFEGRDY